MTALSRLVVPCVGGLQAAQGSLGWGTRTGGVVVAGSAREICGVPFAGNTLRSTQEVSRTIVASGAGPGSNDCRAPGFTMDRVWMCLLSSI